MTPKREARAESASLDPARRLREHNFIEYSPGKHTSRNPGPWMLARQEPFEARAQAMAREK